MFNFQGIRNTLLENTPICEDAIGVIMNLVKVRHYKVGDILFTHNNSYLNVYLITKVNKKSIRIAHTNNNFSVKMEDVISINKNDDKVIIKYRREIIRWVNNVYSSTGEFREETRISEKNDIIFIKDNILYSKSFVYGFLNKNKLHDMNIKIKEDKEGNQYIREKVFKDYDNFFKPDKYILGKVEINKKLKIELK